MPGLGTSPHFPSPKGKLHQWWSTAVGVSLFSLLISLCFIKIEERKINFIKDKFLKQEVLSSIPDISVKVILWILVLSVFFLENKCLNNVNNSSCYHILSWKNALSRQYHTIFLLHFFDHPRIIDRLSVSVNCIQRSQHNILLIGDALHKHIDLIMMTPSIWKEIEPRLKPSLSIFLIAPISVFLEDSLFMDL